MISRLTARIREAVPSSSFSIIDEKPTTSAAGSRRGGGWSFGVTRSSETLHVHSNVGGPKDSRSEIRNSCCGADAQNLFYHSVRLLDLPRERQRRREHAQAGGIRVAVCQGLAPPAYRLVKLSEKYA